MEYKIKKLKFFSLIIYGIILQSCMTTFYGTAPKSIEGDIVRLNIFWNSFSNEYQVREKLEFKINELLTLSDKYHNYLILYQSNNSLKTGNRKFIIHFFESDEIKSQFTKMTEDKNLEFNLLVESESFNKSWAYLKFGRKIEDTFDLFPELKNYYFIQDFDYESNMIYRIQNLEFVFDKNGRLIYWKK